jgi:hypothetical protein
MTDCECECDVFGWAAELCNVVLWLAGAPAGMPFGLGMPGGALGAAAAAAAGLRLGQSSTGSVLLVSNLNEDVSPDFLHSTILHSHALFLHTILIPPFTRNRAWRRYVTPVLFFLSPRGLKQYLTLYFEFHPILCSPLFTICLGSRKDVGEVLHVK